MTDLEKQYEEAITQAAKEWHQDSPRSQKLLHDLIRTATFPFLEKARQHGHIEGYKRAKAEGPDVL